MVLYFGAIVNGLIIMCVALQNIHFGVLAQAGGQKEKYGFDKNIVINEEVRYGYFIKVEFVSGGSMTADNVH